MSPATNPSEAARETLRRLAQRRLAPTPDNFTQVYHEITGHAGARAANDDLAGQLREQLARAIVAAAAGADDGDELFALAQGLAARVRASEGGEALRQLAPELRTLWLRLETRARDRNELLSGTLKLATLLLGNVTELVEDDQWLAGQLGVLRDVLAEPIDAKKLRDAERRFKDVLLKQGTLRRSLDDVKAALKTMVAGFIDRLGSVSQSTGQFHDRMEAYTRRIQETDDLAQLDRLLQELMQDTREMQSDMLRSRDELQVTRRKVQDYEERIRTLERELSQVSEKIREDQLTQALNRRGLDETFAVEIARCRRRNRPMCVALLDIDDFKLLNDRYGHQAGDDALVHVVGVVRETVRPSDSVARYGGEEFAILLPETSLEEAEQVMVRVQRALTRKFFMSGNERLLITFSAGVALCGPAEMQEAVLARADGALYQAKRAGKNRVVAAQDGDPARGNSVAPA